MLNKVEKLIKAKMLVRSGIRRTFGKALLPSMGALSRPRSLMNGADSLDEPHTLVFDLDGTMIDSSGDVTRALNSLLIRKGYKGPSLSEKIVRPMIGDGMTALIKRAIQEASLEAPTGKDAEMELVDALAAIYDKQDYSSTMLLPFVKETLHLLKEENGHICVVATNKDQIPTEQILEHFGLSHIFASVVGGNFLPIQKPHAGHLITAVEMGGGDVNRACMVGDGHNDVLVAQAAHVPVIALDWEYGYSKLPLEELRPTKIVKSFEEIPDALEKLVDASMY